MMLVSLLWPLNEIQYAQDYKKILQLYEFAVYLSWEGAKPNGLAHVFLGTRT
jgi:hypothetical protein